MRQLFGADFGERRTVQTGVPALGQISFRNAPPLQALTQLPPGLLYANEERRAKRSVQLSRLPLILGRVVH